MGNTSGDLYDDALDTVEDSGIAAMDNEEILMSENEILEGLLTAANSKDDEANYRNIQIKRHGKVLIQFRIRPISEDENQSCWRRATKYAPQKQNQPKKAIDTDTAKYRSYVIYTATVDEDRKKIWDNKTALDKLNLMQGVDMIDLVLHAGEKDRILDDIDEISGFDDSMEEVAGK